MAQEDPIDKAILGEWGITALSGRSDDPGEALSDFLDQLNARVKEEKS
jgi:hypothetical protein